MATKKTATANAAKRASKKASKPVPSKKKAAAPKRAASGRPRAASGGKKRRAGDEEVTIDRRRSARRNEDRDADSTNDTPPIERREKVQRRRQIDPTTCERDYSFQEVEFMNAMDEYKRKSGRMFPTCSEVLEVIRELGYVKLSPVGQAMLAQSEAIEADDATAEASLESAGEEHEEDDLLASETEHEPAEATF